MSLSAPGTDDKHPLLHQSSPIVAHMLSLSEARQFAQLRKAISECKDEKIAQEVFQWLFYRPMLPNCWDDFLNNPNLNHILDHKELIYIVKNVSDQLDKKDLSQKLKEACESILVTLASNSHWCEILSYRFFLDFVIKAPALIEHIVFDEDFITHLDFTHVDHFIKQLSNPEHVDAILSYLDEILDTQSHHYFWALETIKFGILKNKRVQQAILETEKYPVIRKVLSLTFNKDKIFAIEVLENNQLSRKFSSLRNCRVFNHPLLSAQDYQRIFKSNLIKLQNTMAALRINLESMLPLVQPKPLVISSTEDPIMDTPKVSENQIQISIIKPPI